MFADPEEGTTFSVEATADTDLCRGHHENWSSGRDPTRVPRWEGDAGEIWGTRSSKKLLCLPDDQTVSCDLFLSQSFFSIYGIMRFKNV